MSTFGHFLYRNKIIIFNLLLAAFIAGLDPAYLEMLPDTGDFAFYAGVFILLSLFLEYGGIWYKSRFIFSFAQACHRKVPWFIGFTFIPRIMISGAIATLALQTMGALEISDFFLLPLVLYATFKEFGVRKALLDTEREKGKRPNRFRIWMGEVMLFIFICTSYAAIWYAYLLETPRIKYVILSPINWGFVAVGFLFVLFCLEMPYFWEEHLRSKSRGAKIFAASSLIAPVIALLARFYMMGSYLTLGIGGG